MGFYIETGGREGKAAWLVQNAGAVRLPPQPVYRNNDMVLVCVVNNRIFEAAAVAFSRDEFEVFSRPDGRHKIWLAVPRSQVIRLCPEVGKAWDREPETPRVNVDF